MGDVKQWSVTYTKHIKQKRKVYQDGFLELHCSNGTDKVLLYDDDMKVLESRFSKKDEVVGCGETLTFGGYLVDVGDLSSDVDCQKAATEIPETKVRLARRPSFKSSIKKETLERNDGSVKHPSIRYNIKKESPEANVGPMKRASFRSSIKKEKENNDLGHQAPENRSSMIKNTEREWRAIYTSQKTQRAKKYHDGILRLVVGMFDRRQVILYDDSRKQLDSKYLKKEEVVECGETLTLDCYLVEVLEEHSEPLSDLNIQGRAQKSIDNFGKLNDSRENGSANIIAPENCPSVRHIIKAESESSGPSYNLVPESCSSIKENINREWHALYTTQKTQKAKKYHDGILRLAVGVAQRRQVTLLNEDGTTLGSKYLSLSEDVRIGRVLELGSHLIEVGEERISEKGLQNDNSSGVAVDSSSGNSNFGSIILSSSNIGKKNIRDANEILSNLKRPTGKSTCPAEEPFIGKATSSQLDSILSQKIVIDSPEKILEDSIEILNGATNAPEVGHRSNISHSEDIDKAPSSDPDCGWKLWPPVPPLLKVSHRSLISETGAVYPGEHTEATIFNSTGPQDSDIVMSDMPDDTRKMNTKVPHGFDDGLLIKECHFFTGSEGGTSFTASDGDNGQMTSGVSDENLNQLCAGRMEKLPTHRKSAEVTFPSSNGSGSCSNGAGRTNTEVLKSKPKEQFQANEVPTFDLGF